MKKKISVTDGPTDRQEWVIESRSRHKKENWTEWILRKDMLRLHWESD